MGVSSDFGQKLSQSKAHRGNHTIHCIATAPFLKDKVLIHGGKILLSVVKLVLLLLDRPNTAVFSEVEWKEETALRHNLARTGG